MNSLLKKYGRTALVTGASSGIGKAFATKLAELGFDLLLVARREELLQTIQSELENTYNIHVNVISIDLSVAGSAAQIYEFVREQQLNITLLINNAGFGSHGELDELDLSNEIKMVDLNCRAVVEMTHTFLPGMKSQKRGGIIITASVLSVFPGPKVATYAASKAFDLSFATSLYGECKPYGIDVLAVLPGNTATEFFKSGNINRAANFSSATPERVVHTALNALGKKPMVVDGFMNKLGVFFSRLLPVKWMIRISQKALR